MVQGARPLPSSPLPSPLASYVLTRTQTTIVPNPEISTLAEDKPAARTSACDPQPKPPHSDPRHDGLLMQYLYPACPARPVRHRCTRKYDVAAGVDRGGLPGADAPAGLIERGADLAGGSCFAVEKDEKQLFFQRLDAFPPKNVILFM